MGRFRLPAAANKMPAITPKKAAHMLACAEYYASEHHIEHWQIDVIAIEAYADGKMEIVHFENALG